MTASPENGSAVDENAGNVIKVVSRLLHILLGLGWELLIGLQRFPIKSKSIQAWNSLIISRAANNFPAGAGQTYFGSDISHFWLDKHR